MTADGCDLLVVGGGPAGSTLAALVKKYAPERRVVLIEKAAGPRHHVGESLLPGLVPVLKELGVFEKIDSAGFPKKIGANYLWGRDRRVWENDFNEVNLQAMIERYGEIPPRIEYAWQVRRSVYDEILLRHAGERGVEVRRSTRAVGLLEEGDRVIGLSVEGPRGRSELRSEFVADCSGQDGFLSRFRRVREYNEALRNAAFYAYFRGAPWKYVYSGHPDKTKIFVCSVEDGWFWYIPIEKDLVSVGFVSPVANLRLSKARDRRSFFLERLGRCAELRPLLERAELVKDFDGSGQDVFAHSDWSYLSSAASGPGWLAAGDAAVFVDPILSTGVTLAHVCAHRAAYTLLSSWREPESRVRGMLWKDYDRYCREAASQYLVLALFWYGNERSCEGWWGRAGELQRAWLPVESTDKAAFVTVSAGLTQHYDRVFSTRGLEEEKPLRPEDLPFLESVLGGEASAGGRTLKRPRLRWPARVEGVFVPSAGEGRLRPIKRVRFLRHDSQDPVQDALNPRRIVTRWHLELLSLLDGRRTAAQVKAAAAEKGVPRWWLESKADGFLAELRIQDVLAEGMAEAAV